MKVIFVDFTSVDLPKFSKLVINIDTLELLSSTNTFTNKQFLILTWNFKNVMTQLLLSRKEKRKLQQLFGIILLLEFLFMQMLRIWYTYFR